MSDIVSALKRKYEKRQSAQKTSRVCETCEVSSYSDVDLAGCYALTSFALTMTSPTDASALLTGQPALDTATFSSKVF